MPVSCYRLLLLACLLLIGPLAQAATSAASQSLSPAEKVARMSDSDVRDMLLDRLAQPQAIETSNPYDTMQQGMLRSTSDIDSRVKQIRRSLSRWPEQQQRFWQSLTGQRGADGFAILVLTLGAMLLTGIVAELLVGWKFRRIAADIAGRTSASLSDSAGYLSLQLLVSLVRLGAFVLGALVVPVLVYDPGTGLRPTPVALLQAVAVVRLIGIISRALLAPYARGIRPFRMECGEARSIHHWVLAFAVAYQLFVQGNWLLYHNGIDRTLTALTIPATGLLMNLIAIACIWRNRDTVNALFSADNNGQGTPLRQLLRQHWPLLASLWLMFLWVVWSYYSFIGDLSTARRISPAWWLTLGFVLIDRLLHLGLKRLCGVEWLQSHTFERRSRRFVDVIQNGTRLILIGVILFFLSDAFGFTSMSMFEETLVQRALGAAIDILVVLLIAYALWQAIQSAVERRLPEPSDAGAVAALEGEGGAAGTSRAETLLPLVRSFSSVVLVIVVTLMALSIVGVEIGPLLAGAGVVGIAIGFGGQKLVQDIISGIFFLLDDAFRRGEYIEAAGLRGTVEQISLRSMRLRHHLGAVQTIPYGEIATVKNLSRDWVTMKLELRLPYNTNVEQVRKIIKKVGLELQEDEEIGPNLLLPLKSQGMMRIEESALIFRMKFTCKPGEQWVIRREAFHRVKEALAANDIHFAHRAVHVLLPEQLSPPASQDARDLQSNSLHTAAAAAQTALSPELQRSDRIDDERSKNPFEDEGST